MTTTEGEVPLQREDLPRSRPGEEGRSGAEGATLLPLIEEVPPDAYLLDRASTGATNEEVGWEEAGGSGGASSGAEADSRTDEGTSDRDLARHFRLILLSQNF